jgi:hypothetical protein
VLILTLVGLCGTAESRWKTEHYSGTRLVLATWLMVLTLLFDSIVLAIDHAELRVICRKPKLIQYILGITSIVLFVTLFMF